MPRDEFHQARMVHVLLGHLNHLLHSPVLPGARERVYLLPVSGLLVSDAHCDAAPTSPVVSLLPEATPPLSRWGLFSIECCYQTAWPD